MGNVHVMNGPGFECCGPGDEQREMVPQPNSSSLKPLKAPDRRRAVFGVGEYQKADQLSGQGVPLTHASKDAPPRPRSQASQSAAGIDLVAPNLGTEASGAEVSPMRQPQVMHSWEQGVLSQRNVALHRGEAWKRTNTADQQSPVPEAAGIANNTILTDLMTQTAQKAPPTQTAIELLQGKFEVCEMEQLERETESERERVRELERERERQKAMEMERERERKIERLRLQEEARARVRAELEKAIRKRESEGEIVRGGPVVVGEIDRNEPDKSPLQVTP
jgi:hypothetical protein